MKRHLKTQIELDSFGNTHMDMIHENLYNSGTLETLHLATVTKDFSYDLLNLLKQYKVVDPEDNLVTVDIIVQA